MKKQLMLLLTAAIFLFSASFVMADNIPAPFEKVKTMALLDGYHTSDIIYGEWYILKVSGGYLEYLPEFPEIRIIVGNPEDIAVVVSYVNGYYYTYQIVEELEDDNSYIQISMDDATNLANQYLRFLGL